MDTVSYAYPALVTEDDGFHLVTFPDVPEAGTDDRDRAVALEESQDALVCALEGYIDVRRPIPAPSALKPGQEIVMLPPLVTAKLALYQAMLDTGTTNVALGKLLGVTETAVRRLVDLRHRSHIEQVDKALAALGRRLVVGVAKAA